MLHRFVCTAAQSEPLGTQPQTRDLEETTGLAILQERDRQPIFRYALSSPYRGHKNWFGDNVRIWFLHSIKKKKKHHTSNKLWQIATEGSPSAKIVQRPRRSRQMVRTSRKQSQSQMRTRKKKSLICHCTNCCYKSQTWGILSKPWLYPRNTRTCLKQIRWKMPHASQKSLFTGKSLKKQVEKQFNTQTTEKLNRDGNVSKTMF